MKKIQKIVISILSLTIIFQLSGVFHVVRVFAEENSIEPIDNISEKQGDLPTQEYPGALEEGATDNINIENSVSQEPVLGNEAFNQNIDAAELQLMPEIENKQNSLEKNNFQINQITSVIGDPVINEIDYDQPGTDNAEFIEIKNLENFSINLNGYSLQLINGSGGGAAIYRTIALPDIDLLANDYYVVCGNVATVANCDLDVSPDTDLIQNGAPDAVALVYSGAIIDTVSYEGDTAGSYTEGSGAAADTGVSAKGISRYPDGSDTNYNNSDFFLRAITPGTANYAGQPTGGQVYDGLSADINFSNNAAELSANWSNFSDPIFPIDHYEYSFWQKDSTSDILIVSGQTNDTQISILAPTTLLENETYYIQVLAVNSQGIKSDSVLSDGVKIDTITPQIIDVQYIIPDDTDQIIRAGQDVIINLFVDEVNLDQTEVVGTFNGKVLTWDLVGTENVKNFVSVYRVEVGDNNTDNAELNIISITDPAGNVGSYQENSNIVIDTISPQSPTSISIMAGTDYIQIDWSDSLSDDVMGYNIYRAESPFGKTPINKQIIPGDVHSYRDYNVKIGHTYHYKITAVDVAGNETDLSTGIVSQNISLSAISKVVGQILDSGIKTGFIPQAHAATKGKVKGEGAIKTEPQTESPKGEEQDVKNWPMIIAIIIAVFIILAGIWYYWVVTRPMNQYSVIAKPRGRKTTKKTVRTVRSRREGRRKR